jgi:hypothetical protein
MSRLLDRPINRRRTNSPLSYRSTGPPGYRATENQGETAMLTDALTNPTVKAAIEALQKGDRDAWSALFEPDAKLYDDGSPRSLREFTREALGHERFTSIDRVTNNGLDLIGRFHSDRWGDFRTYFNFQLTPGGKIARLDIGQAT